jgi:hypothetical protein
MITLIRRNINKTQNENIRLVEMDRRERVEKHIENFRWKT